MKQTKEEQKKKKASAPETTATGEKPVEQAPELEDAGVKEDEVKEEPEENSIDAKVAELEKKNEELSAALAKEKDDYIRLMAEFETFRRRTAEEKLELVTSAASETIKGLLPVLDDCERAMELLEKSSDEAAKEGTGLIYNKLMQYLQKKGLERIEAKGKKFDTDFHEAVAQVPVPEEDRKGLVYDVIETGYLLGGKILRYAKVVVGV
ncbi:MAG: nucleotide exchange factor GrpE [Candidatus Cryptobacteroides sp.]|nr:nucleotide exchange factor GrpE [Bacteroidales bacterium]